MIEIGERRVRLAQGVLVHGHEEVTLLAGADIPANQGNAAEQALRVILDTHHIECRRAILNIPRHLALMKFAKFPSVDPAELRQMAKMEILRQVPYGEDEIIDTYKIIRTDAEGFSLVLLISVLKSNIDQRIQILQNCGLRVEKAALGAESLALWFTENLADLQNRNVLLVNLGADYLDLEVFESGKLVFSRGVSLASIPAATDAAILNEIIISAATYQDDSSAKLDEICFLGSPSLASRASMLSEETQISFRAVDLSKTLPRDAFWEEFRKDTSYAGLVGLCRQPSGIEASLVTPVFLSGNRFYELKKQLIFLLSLTAILLVFIFGWILKKNYEEQRFLSLIDAETKKSEPRVKEAARMKQFIDAAEDYMGAGPVAAEAFTQIHRAAPAGVSLDLFDYQDKEKLTLRGSAVPSSAVFDYTRALEKTPWLSNVRVRYVTKRVINNKETADFEIEAKIFPEPIPGGKS